MGKETGMNITMSTIHNFKVSFVNDTAGLTEHRAHKKGVGALSDTLGPQKLVK